MAHTVLLFASWADAFGPALSLDLPADTTAGAILDAAVAHAGGRPLPKPTIAVNHRYARPGTPVRAGDEVALIPPVAGG
jgi:molybdopterin converting factor small subunit